MLPLLPLDPVFSRREYFSTPMISAESYEVRLHGEDRFTGKAPGARLNEWIAVNGEGQTIQHKQVSLEGRGELTFETFADVPKRILIDSVSLWKANTTRDDELNLDELNE